MNAGIIRKIILLAAISGICGCSSVEPRDNARADQQPILSAEQSATMIKVTVTTARPAADSDQDPKSIVAANSID